MWADCTADSVTWNIYPRVIVGSRIDEFRAFLTSKDVSFLELFDNDIVCYDIHLKTDSHLPVCDVLGCDAPDVLLDAEWLPVFYRYMKEGKYGWDSLVQQDLYFVGKRLRDTGVGRWFSRKKKGFQINEELLRSWLREFSEWQFPDEIDPGRVRIAFKFKKVFTQRLAHTLRDIFDRWFKFSSICEPPVGRVGQLWDVRVERGKRIQGICVNLGTARMECMHALFSMVCTFSVEQGIFLEEIVYG